MPAGQPFTHLCRTLAQPRQLGRVDLHLHTTCSDGTYSPAQIVELGRRSGLAALAITDHDTVAGIRPARDAAGSGIEVCTGVEITAEFRQHELHLLGLFFDLDNEALERALVRLRDDRVGRFNEMVHRLQTLGIGFAGDEIAQSRADHSLGRRHLAEMLVKARRVSNVREAFQRYLGDRGRVTVPKLRLPVHEAIALVRGAGGVAAWAHPTYDCSREAMRELRDSGMSAVEVDYPSCRPGHARMLRTWAQDLGLAVCGGSDCHGPGQPHRAVGARGVSHEEFLKLRQFASR